MLSCEKVIAFARANIGKSFTIPVKYTNLSITQNNITGRLVGFKSTEDWLIFEIKDKYNSNARSDFIGVTWLTEVNTDYNIYLKAGYVPGDEHKEKKEEAFTPFGREANPPEITKEDVKILEREPAPLYIQVPVTIEES